MSEARGSPVKQYKKYDHKTVFPVDFFVDNRKSDPIKRYNPPKVIGIKGLHFSKNLDESPIKRATNETNNSRIYESRVQAEINHPKTVSDSTSAISIDNEYDDGFKLPYIKRDNLQKTIKDFTFPFKVADNSESVKKYDKSAIKTKRQKADENKRSRFVSPKRLFNNSHQNTQHRKSSRKSVFRGKKLSVVEKPKGVQVLELSLSRSEAKAKQPINMKGDGYSTDDHKVIARRKYNSSFDSKNLESGDNMNQYASLDVFPIFESSTDENTPVLDRDMENVFEELWKLADERTPLPDIFERAKPMDATFQYDKNNPMADKCISFDDLVNREVNSQRQVPLSVKVKSAKADEIINSTPFALSKDNPDAYAKQTAYFGLD